MPTGQVHWLPLLQARAIESLVYVVAAGQTGEHAGGRRTYGHSMIIGPWGEVLASRDEGAGVVVADLDMIRLQQLRERIRIMRLDWWELSIRVEPAGGVRKNTSRRRFVLTSDGRGGVLRGD